MLRLPLVSSVLPGFLFTAGHGADTPTRPNIVFLVADDLATRMGCYDDPAAITPNLDRLAGEGVRFRRAYAQGSVCIPSRTSFMLGLIDRLHGMLEVEFGSAPAADTRH